MFDRLCMLSMPVRSLLDGSSTHFHSFGCAVVRLPVAVGTAFRLASFWHPLMQFSLCVECVEGDWSYKQRANADAKFTERPLKLTPLASLWNPDRLDAQISPTLCTCTLAFSRLVEGR